MQSLERATDELFDYSKINLPFTDVDLKQLIEYLLNSYSDEFESEGIKLEMLIEDNLVLNCNEMFFYDIVQNLTNNAIKAMKNSEIKIYRCTIKAHDDKLVMDFRIQAAGYLLRNVNGYLEFTIQLLLNKVVEELDFTQYE